MAIDYRADWDRRLRDEFGGDRDKFYEALVGDIATSYGIDPEGPFAGEIDPYLSGITAADIGSYFVQPRLAASRRNFENALRRGHKQALRGAGSGLAREQLRMGLPLTGAITRTEGSIGRPEGLRASSLFAERMREHEDALLSDPNLYAPIANVGAAVTGEHAKHASRARAGSAAVKFIPGIGPIAGGIMDAITDDQGRLADQVASRFNPGLWSAKRKSYSSPGGGGGLNYQPFGSNEGALGNLYGQPSGRPEEEDYLFGSYA